MRETAITNTPRKVTFGNYCRQRSDDDTFVSPRRYNTRKHRDTIQVFCLEKTGQQLNIESIKPVPKRHHHE